MPTPTLLAATRAALDAYALTAADAVAVLERTLAHVHEHGTTALTRTIPEHVTASSLVLDPSLTRTLLCFHRKGGFWVQPGGHLDADDDAPLAGALRELREETGVHATVRPRAVPVDIDRHDLSRTFGTCRTHIDLGFLVLADPDESLALSEESTDVAWWPLDDLPSPLADRVEQRLATARAAARRSVT